MYAAFFAVLYSLLRTIAPGVYLGGSRISSLRDILDELFILLVGIYIFATHQRMAPVGLRLLGQRRPKPTVTVSEITE
jgi:hypothetical protein